MPDAAFREALSKLCAVYARNLGAWGAYDDEVDAARARILALYAEIVAERDDLMAIAIGDKVRKPSNPSLAERQGEVYEATDIHNRHGIRVRVIKVPPQEFGVGDRVRVTKVEEGQ